MREGNLLAQPFDLAERLQYFMGTGSADFYASENGVIAFLNKSPFITRLGWVDRAGREVGGGELLRGRQGVHA